MKSAFYSRPFDDEWIIKLSHLLLLCCSQYSTFDDFVKRALALKICFEYYFSSSCASFLSRASERVSIIFQRLICFAFKVPKRKTLSIYHGNFPFSTHSFILEPRSCVDVCSLKIAFSIVFYSRNFSFRKSIRALNEWIFDDVIERISNLPRFPFFHNGIFCWFLSEILNVAFVTQGRKKLV